MEKELIQHIYEFRISLEHFRARDLCQFLHVWTPESFRILTFKLGMVRYGLALLKPYSVRNRWLYHLNCQNEGRSCLSRGFCIQEISNALHELTELESSVLYLLDNIAFYCSNNNVSLNERHYRLKSQTYLQTCHYLDLQGDECILGHQCLLLAL